MGRHDHVTPDDTLTEFLPVVVDQGAPSVLAPLADEEHLIDGLEPKFRSRVLRTDIDGGDIAVIAIWTAFSVVTGVLTSLYRAPWAAAVFLALISAVAGFILVGRIGFREPKK